IVTGWTLMDAVTSKMDSKDYAAVGQLYSPARGIDFLVRNLLANPHVRDIVILNATKEDENSGGCRCLIDFFNNGVKLSKNDCKWVIASSIEGYIGSNIPLSIISELRERLSVHEVKTIQECVELVSRLSKVRLEVFHPTLPLLFPVAEIKSNVLPGNRYGHRIEAPTIAEAWIKIIHRIRTTGTIRPTGYDCQWQELIDLMAVVDNEPPGFYFPEPNYLPVSQEFMDGYIPHFLDDAPVVPGVKYTYGQRLRSWFGVDQIEQVINKLVNEIDAASAVMSLWDVADHGDLSSFGLRDKGGSPCLNHIWVRIINDELSLTATFRSNDMFSAWVANAMALRALQQHIRYEIVKRSDHVLTMGPLITLSQSAHIYDDTWDTGDKLTADHYQRICRQNKYDDPAGNFIIEVKSGKIIVTQTTSGGEGVKEFSGSNPLKLVRQICQSSPGIQPEHAAYLGLELQKAYMGVKSDSIYSQDR
ncbi:MAG: thymidylate synthase, partial [Symploca sp. SIO1B1]|nr:thymidylate synthase [Symploca sp. SIO1B1]